MSRLAKLRSWHCVQNQSPLFIPTLQDICAAIDQQCGMNKQGSHTVVHPPSIPRDSPGTLCETQSLALHSLGCRKKGIRRRDREEAAYQDQSPGFPLAGTRSALDRRKERKGSAMQSITINHIKEEHVASILLCKARQYNKFTTYYICLILLCASVTQESLRSVLQFHSVACFARFAEEAFANL